MIGFLANNLLQLVLAALGGGGLAVLLRWVADKYGNPIIKLASDRVDRYLAQPQNQWKLKTLSYVYSALDPLLPELLPQYGSEQVGQLVRLLVQTHQNRAVPSEAIDEVVALYRQKFDPLRQNLNPSPLSNALGEAISAYQSSHPGSKVLVETVEDLARFMPSV